MISEEYRSSYQGITYNRLHTNAYQGLLQVSGLIVFYDGSCPACEAEIAMLGSMDSSGEMTFVDCSASSFDDSVYHQAGINRSDLMKFMHILDNQGQWHTGVDAFAMMYRSVGLPWLGALWSSRFTRRFTEKFYNWFALNRHRLNTRIIAGLIRLTTPVLKLCASGQTQNCRHDSCSGDKS